MTRVGDGVSILGDVAFGPRTLGPGRPAVIIAEIGVNHGGDLGLAIRHLSAAARCGADAVKIQTFHSDELATATARRADYQRAAPGADNQRSMLRACELAPDEVIAFLAEARRLGIIAFSTPFDVASVEFLAAAGVPWMKIASGELVNHELIHAVAETRLPTFMSTGMADLDEVRAAIDVFDRGNGGPLALMHCISSYPAPLDRMNLRAIVTLRDQSRRPVGLSDHSLGRDAAVAALALGACALEKHFTVDHTLPGPDHAMSMEPPEFEAMVRTLRDLEAGGLGSGTKEPAAVELPIRRAARRSIMARARIAAGTVLTRGLLTVKRPGDGLPPSMLPRVLGRRITRDLEPEEFIALEDLT